MNLLKYLPPSVALFLVGIFLSRKAKRADQKNGICLGFVPVCPHCKK